MQAPEQHPDFLIEQNYFNQTQGIISRELSTAELDVERIEPIVAELLRQINRADDWNLLIMHETQDIMLSRAKMLMRSLKLAAQSPYFTRVDFIPDGNEAPETYYIGKYGVMESSTMRIAVVDWRAPISNLYYSGQLGPTYYIAPDGEVKGDLTLKRQFNVSGGELISYYDADVLTRDKLLDEVLGSVSQGRLKEVVTTIQAEQNAVIRYPLDKSLIVQGVAGSGKTTIALHRIAYLLYTHQKTLHPRSLLILAPNPLFLDYISQVLPDLGVNEVNQTTFSGLCLSLIGDGAPKLLPDDRLPRALLSADDAAQIRIESRRKGSARYLDEIEEFLDGIETAMPPDEDIFYGPVLLYSKEELRAMLLTDLKQQPLNRRAVSVFKNVRLRVRAAAVRLKELIQEDCARRADILRGRSPDSPERREKLTALYRSRDERMKEAADGVPLFLKDFPKRWPKLKLMDVYADFLGEKKIKAVGDEDLPALVLIAKRLDGLTSRSSLVHIIIDEAQDYTGAQLALLKMLYPRATYTLVGDMGQSIHFYKDIPGWVRAEDVLGGCGRRDLVTSYRSTIEIMALANKVAKRHAYPGQVLAQPVLRHGETPAVQAFDSAKARDGALLALVKKLAEAYGYNSICVIAKTLMAAKECAETLPGARLLDTDSTDYQAGVLCATIDNVKGLEFDAVIIADADSVTYPDSPEYAKLLYVAMTRSLHRLDVLCVGETTKLIG